MINNGLYLNGKIIMKQQLLVENLSPTQTNIITESQNEGKNLYLSGIFAQAEVRNRNNRIYPLKEMIVAVQNMQKTIEENNGIFSALNHHDCLVPPPDKISHVIQNVYMEGNDCRGKILLLPTPMGQIAKVLIESGTRIGISSVSTGVVSSEGVVSDLQMYGLDIVVQPSANAYPNSLYESLDETSKGRHIMTLAESIQEDATAQKYLVKELKKFFESFKN
jgi:hypothetical protein